MRGKTVYVTGASVGIGKELVRQLAAKGAKVALFARRLDACEQTLKELRASGGEGIALACDVTDRDATLEAFAAAERAVGPCDILIANAGVGYPVKAKRFDAAKARGIIDVNVVGAFNAIEAVLPGMVARKSGQIVGISSLAAYRSFPESHVYCASKAALSAFLEGLRLEVVRDGVAVTTICPGFIRTDMTAANTMPMPLLMDVGPAVRRIVSAIERRAKVYAFPRRMLWFIRLSRLIPEALIAKVAVSPTGRSYKEVKG